MTATYKKIIKIVKLNRQTLSTIDKKLSTQKVDVKNPKYFKLLSKAYNLERVNKKLLNLISLSKKYNKKNIIITVKSKVKLISTKIGAIIWVDAINYAELLGKQIGDVIFMQDMQFKVAGVY